MPKVAVNSVAGPFPCEQCDYVAKLKGNLTKHMAAVHDVNPQLFECDLCSYVAKKYSNLKRHRLFRHQALTADRPREKKAITTKKLSFKCEFCTKAMRFTTDADLQQHKFEVHDINHGDFPCNKCKYVARNKEFLTSHKFARHKIGEHRYPCEYCEYKTAKSMSMLRRHQADRHGLGTEVIECPHCEHTCKRAADMKIHLDLHANGSKFVGNYFKFRVSGERSEKRIEAEKAKERRMAMKLIKEGKMKMKMQNLKRRNHKKEAVITESIYKDMVV